jgi:DNA-binding SARP family transcriptional activator
VPPRPSVAPGAGLSVTALGNVTIRLGGRELTAAEFGYAKPRELLCFLLDRGEATKEQVGLALWPAASTAQLRSSFHTTLHHLRAALGSSDWIEFSSGRYRVNRALKYRYDVAEYEALLGRARQAEDAEGPLAAAVRLYRGDFLSDLAGEEWIEERRTQLRRSCDRALLTLGRLYRAAGRHAEAIDVLDRALAQDPLRESVHRELMRCYAAAGERGRAVQHYRELVELLRAELGVPPAPETAQLEARIRRGGTA